MKQGPGELVALRKGNNESPRDYSARFWYVFQEIADCDLKFAIHTFLGGLPYDEHGIYHSLTK